MGAFITPARVPFRIRSLKRDFPPLYKKDLSRFFLKPFPAVIITAIISTATVIIIITVITTITIGGISIKVKVFPIG